MPPAGALNPRAILRASYTAMFVQAMVVNLTPLLFVTLAGQFGLSFDSTGRRFVCSNSNHIQWVAWERSWFEKNPWFS